MKRLLAKTNRREPIQKAMVAWNIEESYYRKLKENLPQLLCRVVSAAENGECDLMGFVLIVTR